MAENLTQSPMYNLSLSDKELFHSNFLAWLGNNDDTKQFFKKVIKKLSGIDLNQYDNWTVLREYKNFDLCIKKDNDYILVIENKVKSIPSKAQLDRYVGKIKYYYKNQNEYPTKFMLLTLAKIFPDKEDIEGVWEIKTYADLAYAMIKELCCIKEEYHKSLIVDYLSFISNLNDLVEKWQENEDFANNDDLEDLNKISDLRAKIQFSSYCEKLKKEIRNISGIVVFDNNDVKDKEFAKKFDKNRLYIYVDWGYSSKGKSGLLDIAIPVAYDNENENYNEKPKIKYGCCFPECQYTIKIQVQGRSYCHVLEKTSGDRDLVKTGYGAPYTDDLGWFSKKDPKDPQSDSKVNYGNNNLFENGLYPQNKVSNWPFKSYSSTFIYQSKTIKENAQVNAVLQNIVDEVKSVLKWLSK